MKKTKNVNLFISHLGFVFDIKSNKARAHKSPVAVQKKKLVKRSKDKICANTTKIIMNDILPPMNH